jgi:hypothetical protein
MGAEKMGMYCRIRVEMGMITTDFQTLNDPLVCQYIKVPVYSSETYAGKNLPYFRVNSVSTRMIGMSMQLFQYYLSLYGSSHD